MKRNTLAFAFALAFGIAGSAFAQSRPNRSRHAVFTMTNDAYHNEVIAYQRLRSGELQQTGRFATGGRGSGGGIDPLTSQGSLSLDGEGSHLFAVNAASGTVSVFGVRGASLSLEDVQPTFGVEPNAVAAHGDLVYVANSAAASSVIGFRLESGGRLIPIPNSRRFLSGTSVGTGAIAISNDGAFLAVAERTTNNIDVFKIQDDGTLGPIVTNLDPSAGAFALVFAPDGALLVAETGVTGQPNASTLSSFFIEADGKLAPVTPAVPTEGAAACWLEVTPNGKFVYVSNSGSSSVSGFSLGAGGALAPLPNRVVATNPPGSTNLDISVSMDGRFLYTLNGGTGTVGVFSINADGTLTAGTPVTGLPPSAGLNGIAAN